MPLAALPPRGEERRQRCQQSDECGHLSDSARFGVI
jgi:hypothetical protein